MSFVSHAQNAEDVVLRRAFGSRDHGFYVDVGAADPNVHSVTRAFYERGWRGINIEPHPGFFAELVRARPEDTNLKLCLTDRRGTVILFVDPELPGNSTLVPELAAYYREQGRRLIEHDVVVGTLAQVCEENAPPEIDFVKIDVEGAEAQVLKGADFTRFRPRILIVEANNVEEWEPLLLEHGYVRALFDGINLFFVRKEDEALLEQVRAPASVLDDFIPASIQYRLNALEEAVREAGNEALAPGTRSLPEEVRIKFLGQQPPLKPMRSLVVLSSTNQLYSGIGRHLFDFAARTKDRIDFEFAIDDGAPTAVELLKRFADTLRAPVHVGASCRVEYALDYGNEVLGALVAEASFDAVECISWANALTNSAVLDSLPDNALLTYTPHYQPTWSVPMSREQASFIEQVNGRMLARANLIMAVSSFERDYLARGSGRTGATVFVPNGCDFSRFARGTLRREHQLLFVGDHREPRKRFDRTLRIFRAVLERHPDLRLLVIGNESQDARVPDDLVGHVELRGYVEELELCRAYRESLGLILVSDYEAFGIPILEALASGTPAYIADNPVLRSIFEGQCGVRFCPADDDLAAGVIADGVSGGLAVVAETLAGRDRLQAEFDLERTSILRWNALAATWSLRGRWLAGEAA